MYPHVCAHLRESEIFLFIFSSSITFFFFLMYIIYLPSKYSDILLSLLHRHDWLGIQKKRYLKKKSKKNLLIKNFHHIALHVVNWLWREVTTASERSTGACQLWQICVRGTCAEYRCASRGCFFLQFFFHCIQTKCLSAVNFHTKKHK